MGSVEPNHANPSPQSPDSDSSKRDNTASIASESEETRSRRRRRSRWDSSPSETEGTTRKRKSRWADDEPKPIIQLPDFMKGIEFDPEIQVLNCRLLEISRILQSGLPLDDREEGQRSPSPEPIYDNLGVRVNTREYRAKEKLNREKQEIISEMIKRNPAFKPPAGYRPPKLQKKIFLPVKEYPGYNFIGLIIGPRGNTQKRMEKETGAKIVIRGKGSEKEGRNQQKKDFKYGSSDNEDLHVFIEAETQEALDAAAGMVEKFLQVDEGVNEHKRKQLRELATLNGTVRDEELCRQCGETGHRQYECPNARAVTFKSEVLCKICGDGGHPTVDCPVNGTTGKKMNDEYLKFLAEVGATVPESSPKQSPGSNPHPGLGSSPTKEYDETNLYIGCLPRMLEDNDLINLFTSFGDIVKAKVIKDHGSGQSKGYGFVKYADVKMANAAIKAMNGYWLEGRTLAVRIAGKPPPPTAPQRSPSAQPPTQAYPSQQYVSFGYSTAPVPWGPTVPSHSMYPPPPPPGSYYPVPGQHSSPYGMYYPPPPPPPPHVTEAPPPGTVPQNPSSSDTQQSFPSGENGALIPGQSPYMSYPSYYNAVPPPVPDLSTDHTQSMCNFSTSDHSQGLGNVPWEPSPPMPPTVGYSQSTESAPSAPKPPVQPPAENPSAVRDSEFEKFMADLKYHACSEDKVHAGEV